MWPTPIPTADPALIGPYATLSELAAKMKEWASENLRDRAVVNRATGQPILLRMRQIKHAISRSRPLQRERLLSLLVLPELLETATHLGSEPDRDGRPEILAVHHFLAPMRLEQVDYNVWLLVRQTREGQYFYDHAAAVLAQKSPPAF